MKNYRNAVSNIYQEKESLLILGLTGRTGAGCSTVAQILSKNYEDLDLSYVDRPEFKDADRYKFKAIQEYISKKDRWIPFQIIQGSCVILSFVFEVEGEKTKNPCEKLIDYLTEMQRNQEGITFKIDNDAKLYDELRGLNYIFEEIQKFPLKNLKEVLNNSLEEQIDKYYKLYITEMAANKEKIKKILLRYSCYEEKKSKIQDEPPVKYHLYTYLLQKLGNNIRSSGEPYNESFDQKKYYVFAHRISLLIQLIIKYNELHNNKKTRICIDAIRNANESNYLKDRYRPYYLLSISTDEQSRINRLPSMNNDERTNVDKVEYSTKLQPQEIFYHQNISNCFEMADIHLINEDEKNGKFFFITWQLVKYITLMIHPGIITPSHIERCMQLAFNAKYNSGCLSRQVGAVVTGNDYAVKSVGWNDVPKGQLSCNLRDVTECNKGDCDNCYSIYESENDEFRKAIDDIKKCLEKVDLEGRRFPFCFKDIYNGYTGTKNQVHTRALHAEENAFLQISKYGGQGIEEGFLFCTASPCELCSKKAYQLGIKTIYYIDPYPGISQKHILSFGKSDNNPEMKQFYGAIGEAYIALYRPLMAVKDELELVSGVSCKKIAEEGFLDDNKPEPMDLHYKSMKFNLEFKTREIIEAEREDIFEIVHGEYNILNKKLTWTGSSYDGSEIQAEAGYERVESVDKISPYRYKIILPKKMCPKDKVQYKMLFHVKDETHLMHPYMAHVINYPTDYLELNLIVPNKMNDISHVVCKRYADSEMKFEYQDPELDKYFEVKDEEGEEGKKIYTLKIQSPNLFYSYSIEWKFEN